MRMPPAVALCGWIFLGSIVCATYIDLDHMIIPDAFTIGLAIEGLVLSGLFPALHVGNIANSTPSTASAQSPRRLSGWWPDRALSCG